jgi:hypothetical protein
VRWSQHFVTCGFFFKAVIVLVTSEKTLGHFPVSYMVLINFVIIFKPPYGQHNLLSSLLYIFVLSGFVCKVLPNNAVKKTLILSFTRLFFLQTSC